MSTKRLLTILCALLFALVVGAQPGQNGSMNDEMNNDDNGDMNNDDNGHMNEEGDMNGEGGMNDDTTESIGSASSTGYAQSSGDSIISGQTYTSTNTDENAVQITGGTCTMTNCIIQKLSGDTSDSDGSSFYGINSAVYCAGEGTTLHISGGTITTSATGSNGIMAYNYGTINATNIVINTSSNLSRGIHATEGGIINANNLTITTTKTNCSVIATDRGGGTITVNGGTYNTTGDDSAITYSTGTITVNDAEGSSTQGEIAIIEGNNEITLNNCTMTSGSSERAMMILQSGSGDSQGYNGTITINGGTMTLTNPNTPLLEVPTYITATLTLKDVTLNIPSNQLMYVDYNTRWNTYGGTGILILSTDSTCTYTGDVRADTHSTAQVTVNKGATWNGACNTENTAKNTSVTVKGAWNLTADSYTNNLTIDDNGHINTNGYALNYDTLEGEQNITTNIQTTNTVKENAETDDAIYTPNGLLMGHGKETLQTLPAGIYIYGRKKVTVDRK